MHQTEPNSIDATKQSDKLKGYPPSPVNGNPYPYFVNEDLNEFNPMDIELQKTIDKNMYKFRDKSYQQMVSEVMQDKDSSYLPPNQNLHPYTHPTTHVPNGQTDINDRAYDKISSEIENENEYGEENLDENEIMPRPLTRKEAIKIISERQKKIGHRRVDEEGNVTYKKVESSRLLQAIQLGLNHSIGSLSSKPQRDVLMQDFTMIEVVTFPKEGSSTTAAHEYADFKFKTYAPVAFRYFRELFGIKTEDFLISLCAQPPRELSNPGASGSVFFVTCDDEFILKTVQRKEASFLEKLLPGYYMNLNQNPRTLLPKFFGLYCYQSGGKNIRLLIMNNLIPSSIKIHEKYDLKGSTFKRKASKYECMKATPTYKDLDFLEKHPDGIMLESDTYDALIKTLKRDCLVLESFKIMDYSLLMGIHNIDLRLREKRLLAKEKRAEFETTNQSLTSEGANNSGASSPTGGDIPLKTMNTSHHLLNKSTNQSFQQSNDVTRNQNTELLNSPRVTIKRPHHKRVIKAYSTAMESIQADGRGPSSPKPPLNSTRGDSGGPFNDDTTDEYETDDDVPPGGIPARNAQGERLLCFIGIIDILQCYEFKKKIEHTFKSILHDGDTVSVHRPSFYAQRFKEFLSTKVFCKASAAVKHHTNVLPMSTATNQQDTSAIYIDKHLPDGGIAISSSTNLPGQFISPLGYPIPRDKYDDSRIPVHLVPVPELERTNLVNQTIQSNTEKSNNVTRQRISPRLSKIEENISHQSRPLTPVSSLKDTSKIKYSTTLDNTNNVNRGHSMPIEGTTTINNNKSTSLRYRNKISSLARDSASLHTGALYKKIIYDDHNENYYNNQNDNQNENPQSSNTGVYFPGFSAINALPNTHDISNTPLNNSTESTLKRHFQIASNTPTSHNASQQSHENDNENTIGNQYLNTSPITDKPMKFPDVTWQTPPQSDVKMVDQYGIPYGTDIQTDIGPELEHKAYMDDISLSKLPTSISRDSLKKINNSPTSTNVSNEMILNDSTTLDNRRVLTPENYATVLQEQIRKKRESFFQTHNSTDTINRDDSPPQTPPPDYDSKSSSSTTSNKETQKGGKNIAPLSIKNTNNIPKYTDSRTLRKLPHIPNENSSPLASTPSAQKNFLNDIPPISQQNWETQQQKIADQAHHQAHQQHSPMNQRANTQNYKAIDPMLPISSSYAKTSPSSTLQITKDHYDDKNGGGRETLVKPSLSNFSIQSNESHATSFATHASDYNTAAEDLSSSQYSLDDGTLNKGSVLTETENNNSLSPTRMSESVRSTDNVTPTPKIAYISPTIPYRKSLALNSTQNSLDSKSTAQIKLPIKAYNQNFPQYTIKYYDDVGK